MGTASQMRFRVWCQDKWYEHKDELESYGQGLPYTAQEYFNKYKYWLKREYKHQRNDNV